MTFNAAINDVILHARDSCNRDGSLNTLVNRSNPPRVGAATTATRHAYAITINLWSRLEVVK